MDWNKDKSIRLSLICVYVFAAILLALDVLTPIVASWFGGMTRLGLAVVLTVYCGSAAAWPCLWLLRKLLLNVRGGNVFVPENVRYMRYISWCCGAAAFICLIGACLYFPVIVIAVSAAFMMLIVRIVKNAFQQAIDMKSELELTI